MPFVKHNRPVVVIGDIHGMSSQLNQLLATVYSKYGSEVDFYACGDLIDRGPDSKKVIETCIQENIKSCVGNHELWLVQLLSKGVLWDVSGSIWGAMPTFKSYGCGKTYFDEDLGRELVQRVPDRHKDYLLSMPLYHKIEVGDKKYLICHSGLTDSAALKAKAMYTNTNVEMTEDNIWEAVDPMDLCFAFPKLTSNDNIYRPSNGLTQIFGHSCVPKPIVKDHFICLDTGCGTRAPYTLTAIVLPTHEILQVTR